MLYKQIINNICDEKLNKFGTYFLATLPDMITL